MMKQLRMSPLDSWINKKIGQKGNGVTRGCVEEYQLKKLNEVIMKARSLSPFYRKHLAHVGASPLTCLEEFTKYPLVTSKDLAEQAIEMICGSQSQISRVVTLATSGTTGKSKRVYFTADDQELTIDFFHVGMSTLTGPGDRVLILLPGERPGSVGDLLAKGLLRIEAHPVPYGLVGNLQAAVMRMCQEQVHCLVGIPVQILAMARYWETWGKRSWAPRCVLLSTDYVPTAIVAELKRIWSCQVYEHYGMTEMGLGGGVECEAHAGYHLREADLYFEVVDPFSGMPMKDGECGEVVFTTLTRQGMPFIRYQTGDIARLLVEPCPCGSWVRRLERVQYRKTGQVLLGQGRTLTLSELDEVIFSLPDIVNFSATLTVTKTQTLTLVLEQLSEDRRISKAMVVAVVRRLPAIKEAEQRNQVRIEVEFVTYPYMLPGKRSIVTTVE